MSKKRTYIAHSTLEVEFIALITTDKEAYWIRDLLLNTCLWNILMPFIPMYYESGPHCLKIRRYVKLEVKTC